MKTKAKAQKKQKPEKQKKVVMTEAEVKKLKRKVSDYALKQMMLIVLAYMMDEGDYAFCEADSEEEKQAKSDKLVEMWDKCVEWCNAMNETRVLKVRTVEQIIYEARGIKVFWNE